MACALLLVLVASAGCLGLTTQSELPDGETVAAELGSVEAMEGNLTVAQTIGNETTVLHMEFVQRLDTGELRATMRRESPEVRYRVVSNGTTAWYHNLSSNTVRRVDLGGVGPQWNDSVESVGGMFESLRQSADEEDVTISPLPVVPGGSSGAVGSVGGASMHSMGNITVTYQGMATAVDGKAHVIDVAPATNASLVENGTLWFDAERYFPVKTKYAVSVGGRSGEITRTYRNVTYNPPITAGTFTFEPPANATVESDARTVATYQSRDALVSGADQSVPEPALPDGYEFAQGSTAAAGENRTLAMQFSNGTTTLVVSKRTPATDASSNETAENATREAVDVAGHDGTLRRTEGTHTLTWQCDGSEYAVTGSLSGERLEAIAESMACE